MITRQLLLFTFLLFSVSAFSQDDEEKAPTLEQAKAKFDAANKELNTVWTKVKATLAEEEFIPLQIEQRGWLQYREYIAGYNNEEGSAQYLDDSAHMTETRALWLEAFINDELASSAISGRWSDSYGGFIDIVEEDGKFYFNINVVRGPTFHLGNLAGIGVWNHPIGWFSDKGRDETKEDETNLAFVWKNKILEVTGANTGPYHGARAYFDGRYVKIGKVSVKEAAEIIKHAEAGFEEP